MEALFFMQSIALRFPDFCEQLPNPSDYFLLSYSISFNILLLSAMMKNSSTLSKALRVIIRGSPIQCLEFFKNEYFFVGFACLPSHIIALLSLVCSCSDAPVSLQFVILSMKAAKLKAPASQST